MISLETLKYLATQKCKDAHVLFKNGRNGGAIYLMGYAIEFSLKRKISLNLGFANGFPETGAELASCFLQLSPSGSINRGIGPTQIQQIRNHRLNDLLAFSGIQGKIITSHLWEWKIISSWDPGKRYKRQRICFQVASDFLMAAKQILKVISIFIL